ncbi:hypothetical protein T484DRAFT_1982188 [Baffinella frigidus]|nr:hypothetical protein T484DRAFT_1982188 [Cryptophyta sp. CCMP2293]
MRSAAGRRAGGALALCTLCVPQRAYARRGFHAAIERSVAGRTLCETQRFCSAASRPGTGRAAAERSWAASPAGALHRKLSRGGWCGAMIG